MAKSPLQRCIAKAGKLLSPFDAQRLEERYEELREQGEPPRRAAMRALADHQAEAIAELEGIAESIKEAGIDIGLRIERGEAFDLGEEGRPAGAQRLHPHARAMAAFEDRVAALKAGGNVPDAALDAIRRQFAPKATLDPVTGLLSREAFRSTIDVAKAKAADSARPAAYIEADFGNLGGLNAAFGTSRTDPHLRAVADILREEAERAGADEVAVFRKGGDEFGVILSGATVEVAEAAATRARQRVADYSRELGLDAIPHTKGGREPGVALHFGVAPIEPLGDVHDTLTAADTQVEARKRGELDYGTGTTQAARARRDPGAGVAAAAGVDARGGNGETRAEPERRAPDERPWAAPARRLGSTEAIRTRLTQEFGERVLRRLEQRGLFMLVQTEAEAAAWLDVPVDQLAGDQGAHNPVNSRSVVIADNTRVTDSPGVLLHELGAHYGIRAMVGEDEYQQALDVLRSLRDSRSRLNRHAKEVRDAYALVAPEVAGDRIDHEALGYLVERDSRLPVVQRVLARVQAFLNRHWIKASWLGRNPMALKRAALAGLRYAAMGPVDRKAIAPNREQLSGTGRKREQAAVLHSRRTLTHDQERALEKAGLPRDAVATMAGLRGQVAEAWRKVRALDRKALGDRMTQAGLDRFHGLKAAEDRLGGIPAEQSAYVAARLSTGLPSITEALLLYGAPKWQGGILTIDSDAPAGLLDALNPVAGELDDWLGWMVGRRAKRLQAEGREHLMDQRDIESLLALSGGREAAFTKAAKDYEAIKSRVLDVAERAGILNPKKRAAWDHAEYIPFYRDDGGDDLGPGTREALEAKPLAARDVIQELKGGTSTIRDPLANIVRNFTTLIDASLKNEAMRRAVRNLGDTVFEEAPPANRSAMVPMSQVRTALKARGATEAMIDHLPESAMQGVRSMLTMAPPSGPDVVRILDEGQPRYYRVKDPLVLRSLTAFRARDPDVTTKVLRWFKRLLTHSVTADPRFLIANFLRDTGSSWVVTDDRLKLGVDAMRGLVKTMRGSGGSADMMMAGGSFIGGLASGGDKDATAGAIRRALRAKGMSEDGIAGVMRTVADTPAKLWDHWQRTSSAIENANREAVYEAAIKAGRPKAEAVFMAKDLLDFSMHGDSALMQWFGDVLPFFNARLQGLYKLKRAGALPGFKLRRAVAARGAVMVLNSLALLGLNLLLFGDAFDELEEWDRDTFWHFAPGTPYHVRVPKPFEMGWLFGTIPERIAMAAAGAAGKEFGDTPKQAARSVFFGLTQTLAFDPIPQAVQPLFELAKNRNSFTGRPIEDLGDQQLLPEARAEWWTSDTMKALSQASGYYSGLSPKQLEHLWDRYLGPIGVYALAVSDIAARSLLGAPARPELALRELPVVGSFLRGDSPGTSRYVGEFYDLLGKVEAVAQTIKAYETSGRSRLEQRAEALRDDHAELLGQENAAPGAKGGFMFENNQALAKLRDALSNIRKEQASVAQDRVLTRAEKREKLDELTDRRNRLAEDAVRAMRRGDPAMRERVAELLAAEQ